MSKRVHRRGGNPNARATLQLLRAYESRNITHLDPDGSWPIVWERAKGCRVWDADGREYLDLTAAFGVANAGHANPRVVRAAQQQAAKLLHAMGDVHPHALKAKLARELSRLTFERWAKLFPRSAPHGARTGKTIFCNSGFEAVEAALKTAMLATGRSGVIAFEGGYHGTGYGALNTTHRGHFRDPFRRQLADFATFVPFPETKAELPALEKQLTALLRRKKIGAILVEPVQGRAGIRVPPFELLRKLRRLCNRHGALLIVDEIFTGFGRTGKWFACEHSRVVPDVICLGKALTGGFPLSACVGRADLMDAAWPVSDGEAIHTSTFLGHPIGCAMALAQISELRRLKLPERAARLGAEFARKHRPLELIGPKLRLAITVRGIGLMTGIELRHPDGTPAPRVAMKAVKHLLFSRCLVLPEGPHGNVISLTPPLTIARRDLDQALVALIFALLASAELK